MEIKCSHQEIVDAALLTPNPRNPNKHGDRQIELLAKIIGHTGFRHPIVVSKRSGFIVAGHGRLQAAQKLGLKEVPVDYQDFRNEAEEFEFLIADNKIAELAEHDDNLMIEGIKELQIEDLELLGLDDFEIPLEPEPAQCDEDDVPTDVDTRCKLGDVWELGEHRLLCGDATDVLCVEKLMDGAKADMVFTDPPYGMNLDTDYSSMIDRKGNSGSKFKPVIGDGDDFSRDLIDAIFAIECSEVFIFGADYFAELIPNKNQGSWIVWDKRSNGEGHIGILDGSFGSDFELCWSKSKHQRNIARIIRQRGAFLRDGHEDKTIHPTQKPIALAEWFFDKWGKDKTNIIDLYGGSGSTLIACEKTQRKCYMMELDPHYCDVILSRWEKYTGKEAVLGKD